LKEVPRPKNISFSVEHAGKKVSLAAHYWYNARLLERGENCPAILEINPYRRRGHNPTHLGVSAPAMIRCRRLL
jgi:hypothetical protein